jgi:hypothetical protein
MSNTVSWMPEVIADNSGKWCGNGLRFATEQEALDNVRDLAMRWFAVRDMRAVPCNDPVNYSYATGSLVAVCGN